MAGFMAGFGTTLSNSIEADREYYREAASKRRDYLQTYGTKAVVDREDKANAAMGVVNGLRTAGVDDNTLRFVLDKSGIQGVVELSQKISSRDDLTKDDIAGLVKGAKDYVSDNPDASFSEVINRAYGLYKSTDKPVERQRNIFASVLGLDARMAEDEVLDDLYVNGYSGRDMYRIMGASGPKSGEALDLNLPAKPPSVAALTMANKELSARFEQSIDAEIRKLTQQVSDASTEDEGMELTKALNALTALKGRGVQGYTEWANTDPRFWDYAKSLEVMVPGIITRNPSMVEFGQNYTTYWGDKEDNAQIDSKTPSGNNNTISDKVETSSGNNNTISAKVTNFDTAAAFNAAVLDGTVLPGALVTIGDGPVQTLPQEELPSDTVPEEELPSDTVLKGVGINPITATGSKPVTPESIASYQDLAAKLKGLTDAEAAAYEEVYKEVENTLVLGDLDLPGVADATAGKAVGYTMWTLGALNNATAKVFNFFPDNTAATTERILEGNQLKEQAVEVMTDGLVESLENKKDAQYNSLVAAAEAITPEDIARIKAKLMKSEAIQTVVERAVAEANNMTPEELANKTQELKEKALNLTSGGKRQEEEDMQSRIQDSDRQFIVDQNNFPNVKPKVAQEKPTASEISNREADALQARIQDKDRQFLADDSNFPNAPPFVGRPVDKPSKEPSKLSEFLSLVKILATSTDEEKYKVLGWNEPKGLMSSRRPKVKPLRLGQPEFMDLIKTLHGSGSSVTATWEEKTSSPNAKLKVSDVTRLIKETKALPETKSRGKLLESLYDLRDVLNKRK